MDANLPESRVSNEEMRRIFNSSDIPEKITTGEYKADVIKSSHADPRRSGQVYCTLSETVDYLDLNGVVVVRVHRYLLPDGQIGGSGRPDPKRLVHNNVIYKLAKVSRLAE